MACTDQIPVTSKRGGKALTKSPHEAGHGKVAKAFMGIVRETPNSGHSKCEDVVQRPCWCIGSTKVGYDGPWTNVPAGGTTAAWRARMNAIARRTLVARAPIEVKGWPRSAWKSTVAAGVSCFS